MATQAIGTNHFLPAAFQGGLMQPFGQLGITILAISILSNLSMAQAREATYVEKEACKINCRVMTEMLNSPVPERICVETCIKGSEMIETTTKEALKDGKWKAVEVLGKVFKPIDGLIDCTSVCDPSTAILQEGGLAVRAAWNLLTGYRTKAASDAGLAAVKAACTASLLLPGGKATCMACCAGIKLAGVA